MPLTPEQQAIRSARLTGSTIAGLLRHSPWESPLEAWELQMGLREFAGNDDTVAGQFMESSIGRLTLHELGLKEEDVVQPGTLLHPDLPDVFAVTPDLVIPRERIGVQIKNHMPWAVSRYKGRPQTQGRWDNHLLPDEKLMQCLLELEIVSKVYGPEGWDVWFLAAFFGGSHLRAYWIRRDTRTIHAMLQAGRRFWTRHLDPSGPQEPPSPECTCGGCGRGERWWIGRERPEPKRTKLTPAEIEAAPDPFPTEDDGGWAEPGRLF